MTNDEHGEQKYQSISDSYDGKSVFVTGGTGFLGKVFIEKILYRCPKIDKVYVLIRDTEKISSKEKFKKLLDSPIFKRLQDERPDDLKKIILIAGDISQPQLGIQIEDEKLLIENVSMVFHFAATVKFNEPLHVAFNLNLEGTRRVLDLCVKMKKIQVFLYVSTAFTSAVRQASDEIVYPPPIPLSDLNEIMKQKEFTEEETIRLLHGNPNTYTLTKALAESLVAKFHEQEDIPTIIVRPSIVVSCQEESMSGWIDNWYGATPLVVTVGKGLIRTLLADGNNTIDLIPADYVANLIAAAAARCKRSKNLEVYNSCTSAANPISIHQLESMTVKDSIEIGFNELPLPGVFYCKSRWLLTILTLLLETLPAYLGDCWLRIIGKKPRFMKMQSRVSELRKALEPFTSRTWMMSSQNTSALSQCLSSSDRSAFPCDPKNINWTEFVPTYCRGIRKYLLESKNN